MTEAEIINAFSGLDRTSPIWQAVAGVMDKVCQESTEVVAIPESTDAARHFNAGRLSMALDARGIFEGIMDENERRRKQ